MSLSLLLAPNNLGPFYINSTIELNNIDALTVGGILNIGTVNAGTIKFGNSANLTDCDFSLSGSMTLPKGTLTPYVIKTSGAEIISQVNLSGAVNTGQASCRFRRIGNWVDVYVYYNNTSVGVTGTLPITLSSAVPTNYISTTGITCFTQVLDTGVSAIPILGICTIDTSGNITFERADGNAWSAGGNWGFNSVFLTYTVV